MDPSVVEMNLSRGQLNGEKPTTKREGKDEETVRQSGNDD